jgi:hypothetical protein
MLERSGVPVSPPGMVETAVEGSALRIAGSG